MSRPGLLLYCQHSVGLGHLARSLALAESLAGSFAVKAEQGCIEYGAAVDCEPPLKFQTAYGPDTFVVVEKWESPEALMAHAAAPHMAAYAGKTKEFIASRAIHILQPA